MLVQAGPREQRSSRALVWLVAPVHHDRVDLPISRFEQAADTGGLGVALAVPVYIPTGDADSFRTDEAVRVAPTLVVDFATDAFRLAANVG